MELNTIIDLVKAGFTKDEIMQLQNTANPSPAPEAQMAQEQNTEPVQLALDLSAPNPEPAPAPVNEPAPVAVPAPAPVPAPVPVAAPVTEQPTMTDIMQSIAKLTSAIQANAISQSVIPGGLQNPPSAEDMLAEIIRPTFRGKE